MPEGLFGASGVSWECCPISANRPQVASLFQGIFLPGVPVNRNKLGFGSCESRTEAPFHYCFPHSPFFAVMTPLVLQSPLSLPGHRRPEYLMCSSKGFGKKTQNNYGEKKNLSCPFNVTEKVTGSSFFLLPF